MLVSLCVCVYVCECMLVHACGPDARTLKDTAHAHTHRCVCTSLALSLLRFEQNNTSGTHVRCVVYGMYQQQQQTQHKPACVFLVRAGAHMLLFGSVYAATAAASVFRAFPTRRIGTNVVRAR